MVSRNPDEHRRHLHAIFDIINEYGFRVDLGKFSQPSIKYLGIIVDKDGRLPGPSRYLCGNRHACTHQHHYAPLLPGLVNYYQSFVPNMRAIRQPLDELLEKYCEWI